jgi:hypothetical protein
MNELQPVFWNGLSHKKANTANQSLIIEQDLQASAC